MENRINVSNLQIGMFVAELDRPWLDTPFLLQGFVISDLAELELLREHCEWVVVDFERSIGGVSRWVNLLSPTPAKAGIEVHSDASVSSRELTPEEENHVSVLKLLREVFSFKHAHGQDAPRAPTSRIIIYEESRPVAVEIREAENVHQATRELVSSLIDAVRNDVEPKVEEVNEAVAGMVDSIVRNPNALLWLAHLKDRDDYTYRHAIDTAVYLLAFGRHLGFPKDDLHKLGFAGLMLDIGKMKLSDDIINKQGIYSRSEFMMMKSHVQHSLDILGQMADVPMDVYDMVARHHERYDGSGYPYGLRAEWIGMYGSMAGIVDCYTALTSDRPYAAAKTAHEAVQTLMHWSEKYFHPQLVEQFAQSIGVFHIGAIVELSSGDIGIVIGQNRASALKPKVMLILGPDKEPLPNPQLLDLQNDPRFLQGEKSLWILHELPRGSFGINPREYFL